MSLTLNYSEIEFSGRQSGWNLFPYRRIHPPIRWPQALRWVDLAVESIIDMVQEAHPELSARECLDAEFILGAPGELGACGASDLAWLMIVSLSSKIHFVKQLGLDRYEKMRRGAPRLE